MEPLRLILMDITTQSSVFRKHAVSLPLLTVDGLGRWVIPPNGISIRGIKDLNRHVQSIRQGTF